MRLSANFGRLDSEDRKIREDEQNAFCIPLRIWPCGPLRVYPDGSDASACAAVANSVRRAHCFVLHCSVYHSSSGTADGPLFGTHGLTRTHATNLILSCRVPDREVAPG